MQSIGSLKRLLIPALVQVFAVSVAFMWVGAVAAEQTTSAPLPITAETTALPKPVVVYLAGGTPKDWTLRTVVYDNGLVVYDDDAVRQDHAHLIIGDVVRVRPTLHSVQLSRDDFHHLLDQIQPAALLHLESSYQMYRPWYYKVIVWQSGQKKEVEAGGFIYREGTNPEFDKINVDIYHKEGDAQDQARRNIPSELLRAMDTLQYYTNGKAVTFPNTNYSLYFKYAGAGSKGKTWPSSLPPIDLSTAADKSAIYSAPVDQATFETIDDAEWKSQDNVYRIGNDSWHVIPFAVADLPNHQMWDDSASSAPKPV